MIAFSEHTSVSLSIVVVVSLINSHHFLVDCASFLTAYCIAGVLSKNDWIRELW